MKSRRLAGAIILLLVPLAACSDPDVDFPPGDGSAGAAGGAPDARPDADASVTPDVLPDITVDMRADAPDSADRSEAETGAPDVGLDEGIVDSADVTIDPTSSDAETGADSHDAVSEDADTCESHCASGVCDTNGNCKPCVKDDECKGGLVCNAGTCGPRCGGDGGGDGGDGGTTCAAGLDCCNEHCVDTTRDPQHCGACSTVCLATQFCGNASAPTCKDNTIVNVCNTKNATFLLNGLPDDDGASAVIKAAVMTHCNPVPTMVSIDQSLSTAINNTSGQPLVGGGNLLVAAGGDSTQILVRYLESSGTSAVYNESDGATYLRFLRRGGAADGGDSIVVDIPLPSITPTHDYFLVEIVKDPVTGTLSLVVYGIDSPGTRAGAWYFANQILPNVGTFTQSWYVYEWTTSDADAGPSASDTFTLKGSGN